MTYGTVVLGDVLEVPGSGKLFSYDCGTAVKKRLANAHYTGSGVVQRHWRIESIAVLKAHLIRISTGDENISKTISTENYEFLWVNSTLVYITHNKQVKLQVKFNLSR